MDENHRQTRRRLLEAAGELFAELGYQHATIREICHKADVNVAAVNYHFRDKLGLYLEVFSYSQQYALEKYPPDLGLGAAAGPRSRLEAFIRSFLLRVREKGRASWHGKLILRELVDPSPLLDKIVENHVRPLYRLLNEIVR